MRGKLFPNFPPRNLQRTKTIAHFGALRKKIKKYHFTKSLKNCPPNNPALNFHIGVLRALLPILTEHSAKAEKILLHSEFYRPAQIPEVSPPLGVCRRQLRQTCFKQTEIRHSGDAASTPKVFARLNGNIFYSFRVFYFLSAGTRAP